MLNKLINCCAKILFAACIACLQINASDEFVKLQIDSYNPLIISAMHGDEKGVKEHKETFKGRRDKSGKTALVHAINSFNFDCVALLLEESTMQDLKGWSALEYAIDGMKLALIHDDDNLCNYFDKCIQTIRIYQSVKGREE